VNTKQENDDGQNDSRGRS